MILQNLGDCSIGVAGTGIAKCSNLQKGNPIGGFFVDKGTKLTNLNKATLDTLLLAGKLHSVIYATGYEMRDMEDQYATSSTLFQSKVQDAKPTETFKYWLGNCFYTNIKTLESYNEYDFIKVFEKGIELVNHSSTQLKGFDLGMVTIPHYKEQVGTEPAEATFKIQYVKPEEMHSKRIFYLFDNLDFDLSDFKGIYQTAIKVVSNTGGVLKLKVVDNCNSSIDYTGAIPAVAGSFALTGGTITTVALTDGNIVINYTGSATGVRLNIVEDVNGNFYKSGVTALS
jgi:hypothetical protein